MGFDLSPEILREAILVMLVFFISLTLREWAHAKVADLLGDPTPRAEGRVTLNPWPHVDPLGTIVIPLIGALHIFGSFTFIGWGKPVMFNPSYFRRPKWDASMATLAGTAMNFLIALAAVVIAALLHRVAPRAIELTSLVVEVNVLLIVFNLLPFPPLDGSKLLVYWFGMSEEAYNRYAQWGGYLLLALYFIPQFQRLIAILESLGIYFFNAVYQLIAR